MSRRAIRHGGVVACDMPGCPETFTTYSVLTLARKQVLTAGWARVKGRTVQDSEGNILAMGGAKVDLCPKCKPKPVMGGAR